MLAVVAGFYYDCATVSCLSPFQRITDRLVVGFWMERNDSSLAWLGVSVVRKMKTHLHENFDDIAVFTF